MDGGFGAGGVSHPDVTAWLRGIGWGQWIVIALWAPFVLWTDYGVLQRSVSLILSLKKRNAKKWCCQASFLIAFCILGPMAKAADPTGPGPAVTQKDEGTYGYETPELARQLNSWYSFSLEEIMKRASFSQEVTAVWPGAKVCIISVDDDFVRLRVDESASDTPIYTDKSFYVFRHDLHFFLDFTDPKLRKAPVYLPGSEDDICKGNAFADSPQTSVRVVAEQPLAQTTPPKPTVPAPPTDKVVHFVRITRQVVPTDRSVVPIGGEVAIKYETDEGWVPYMEIGLPLIPKTSATLIEEIVFSPPIEGVINKLTPLYMRENLANSIATALRPSLNGEVLQNGDQIKIYQREGDYYLASSKVSRLALSIPVGAVNVASVALASGRVVPAPRPSAAAPATSATAAQVPSRSGTLFGKLKVPFAIDGKTLAAGSYITLSFDAGDYWIVGNSLDQQTLQRISKAAVDVVSRVEYLPVLPARIKSPTTVYKLMPDVSRTPGTLEQSDMFANMNPTVHVGDDIYIAAREGDDYIIQLLSPGMAGKAGRVPVSAVMVVSGNPGSGAQVVVPPLPQHVQPPQRLSGGDWAAVIGLSTFVFAVISVVVAGAGAIFRSMANRSNTQKGQAEYGVPHTKFVSTPDGFEVSFSKRSERLYKSTDVISRMQSGGGLAAILLVFFVILFCFFLLFWYGVQCFFTTVIKVDRESVTINGKKMARRDFGNFIIDHSLSGDRGQVAVLGYQFGRTTLPFGGVWKDGLAQEVANALNSHLRSAPMAGDEHHPSPEALRQARPTDF